MAPRKTPGKTRRRPGRSSRKRRSPARPELQADSRVQAAGASADSDSERDGPENIRAETVLRRRFSLERETIGRELHDTVGQELTGLGLMAETLLETLLVSDSPEVELATKLFSGIKRVLGQVRTLAQGLVPLEIDSRGLTPALTDLAARTMELYGVACTFESVAGLAIQHDATATHLFRIAQEAIINAVKHGRARHIAIGLSAQDGEITLRVRDDGCGIDERKKSGAGMGLPIMRYRAGILHGQLTIEPAKGGGTVVSCTLSDRGGPSDRRR